MKKNKRISKLVIPIGVFMLVPSVAFGAPKNFKELVDVFLNLINLAIPIIIALAVVVFIWGLVRYVTSESMDTKKEAGMYILYGIIGITVMVSLWGLVGIVRRTFFGSSNSDQVRQIDDQNREFEERDFFNSGV